MHNFGNGCKLSMFCKSRLRYNGERALQRLSQGLYSTQLQSLDSRYQTQKVQPGSALFFLPYLFFTHFTLLNLLTGIIVENVVAIRHKTASMRADERRRKHQEWNEWFGELLRPFIKDQSSPNGTGTMTKEAFCSALCFF